MKTIKEIVAALSKEEGVSVVKNASIIRSTTSDVNPENGACMVVCRLDREVPAYVQVTAKMLEALANGIAELETALKAEKDDEKKAQLTAMIAEGKAKLDSLDEGDWTEGMSDTIFISNFDIIGSLRNDPRYVWLAKYLSDDPESIDDIIIGAKINVICQKVSEGETYVKPFSAGDGSVVPNTSIYHTPYNLRLSEIGEEEAMEIKKMLREIKKDKLKSKMLGGKRVARAASIDEDED